MDMIKTSFVKFSKNLHAYFFSEGKKRGVDLGESRLGRSGGRGTVVGMQSMREE